VTENRTHDVAAIEGVLADLYKAWDEGDADTFVADYLDDATVIMPGTYRTSKEEVRQGMAQGFASFLKGSTTVNSMEGIRFLGENAAIAVSESGILFAGETEVPADRMVYATWVLEKRDGHWLVAAYHNSPTVLTPA
jgi:uncharacterized protein (TIGR02246 family)